MFAAQRHFLYDSGSRSSSLVVVLDFRATINEESFFAFFSSR